MKTLKFNEIRTCAQLHTACILQIWGLDPERLTLEPRLSTIIPPGLLLLKAEDHVASMTTIWLAPWFCWNHPHITNLHSDLLCVLLNTHHILFLLDFFFMKYNSFNFHSTRIFPILEIRKQSSVTYLVSCFSSQSCGVADVDFDLE